VKVSPLIRRTSHVDVRRHLSVNYFMFEIANTRVFDSLA